MDTEQKDKTQKDKKLWLVDTEQKVLGELCQVMDPTTASWLRKGGGRWGLKYYANFWNSLNRSIHGMMNMIQYEFCTKLLNFSLIHGIGGGIQASEALQIKVQTSCAHNCQVGELYWCFFYITLLCVDFWPFYVISIILYYLRTEVDIAEINWINKKSITSIGVSCDHCKEVQKLTRNIGRNFCTFETNKFKFALLLQNCL